MPIHELGAPIAPLDVTDVQRVTGGGWYDTKNPAKKYRPLGVLQYDAVCPKPGVVYVLPQVGDLPAYVGSPCGLCTHKARHLSGGCQPGDPWCKTAGDLHLYAQVGALQEDIRVRDPASTAEAPVYLSPRNAPGWRFNANYAAWPDEVPLLCNTVKGWVSALDPNADGRLQQAAFLAPDKAYRTVTIPKADGRVRRLHVPCGPLMELQSRILERTLNRCVWPEHVAAYVPGRQLLDTAKRHAGKPLVITLDLKNFFGSTMWRMVHDALVETYGYNALGATTVDNPSTTVPIGCAGEYVPRVESSSATEYQNSTHARSMRLRFASVIDNATSAVDAQCAVRYLTDAVTCPVDTRKPKGPRALPQGAPTSGAFANLVGVHRLDPGILRICTKWGFTYSRYADDLIFSRIVDLSREETTKFINEIADAVFVSGYRVNWKKLRVQRKHQQQRVLGLVVNDGVPKVPRKTRMLLRAQQHFAMKYGPDKAAERNLKPGDLDEDASPEEVFRRKHKGRVAYVRHIHEDHFRGCMNLTPQQWNGAGY